VSLLTNLISYWKLDEASGNALDAHGSNDLTDNNTVGTATGKINGARDFIRANSEYFNHADNADFSFGDEDFTFAGWVQFNTNGIYQFLFAKDNQAGSGEYSLYRYSDDKLYFYVKGTGDITHGTTSSVSGGAWHYIVVWHDSAANQVAIQVDNATAETASYSGGCHDGTFQFCFGADSTPNNMLGAYLDEWGMWGRVLTADERTSLYNSGNGLAYSEFGGGSGVTVNASVVSVTASLPSRTVTGGALVAPAVQNVTASLPSRTVTGGALVQPAVQALTASLPAALAKGGALATPNVQVLTTSLPARTIKTGARATPNVQVVTASTAARAFVGQQGLFVEPSIEFDIPERQTEFDIPERQTEFDIPERQTEFDIPER
jgi:hypothetical protein